MSYYKRDGDLVTLFIKASPSSSKNEIIGCEEDSLKVKLKAPPVDGEANRELISFFAKTFGVAKSDIVLAKGQNAKRKQLRLPTSHKLEQFLQSFPNETKSK